MIGCIIQARMGSTRLPGKILKKIDDEKLVLDFLINQLKSVKCLEKIIIATTKKDEDDVIEEFSRKNKLECFRGDEDDVLERYYQAAKKYGLDIIIRITSDDPLVDPEIIDYGMKIFNSEKLDLFSTNQSKTFPHGIVFEIFSFNALKSIINEVLSVSEREHVTPFFYSNEKRFKIHNFSLDKDMSHIRCSLDTPNDLTFLRELIKKIENRPIHLKDVILASVKFPELLEINNKN